MLPADLATVHAEFTERLATATDLGPATREKYRRNTADFLVWLGDTREAGGLDGDPLTDAAARDWAVRDYRRALKNTRTRTGGRLAPATINNRLAAIETLFVLRGAGRPALARERLARPSAPRALDTRQTRRFLRQVARDASARDAAICHLAYYAGLRVAEICALDAGDVRLSARKGSITVLGKGRSGGTQRTVVLHAEARASLTRLLDDLGRPKAGPLIRNRTGRRLSTRAAHTTVAALGAAAGLGPADNGEPFGPHTLRHTFGTDLVRAGHDLVTLAELMGHTDINTTRRYALPTETDKATVLDDLTTDQ